MSQNLVNRIRKALIATLALACSLLYMMANPANALWADEVQDSVITYTGLDDQFTASRDGFFDLWQLVMPGDSCTTSITMENASDTPIELYFQAQQSETTDWLETLELSVSDSDGDAIYEGSLAESGELNPVDLGRFEQGESEQLTFTLEVPAELGNEYAMSSGDASFAFSVEEVTEATPQKTTTTQETVETPVVSAGTYDKTGIDLGLIVGLIIACGGVGAAGIFLSRKLRRNHD